MSVTVETQLHQIDHTLAVGERAFDFDAAIASSQDVNGIELMLEWRARAKFLFVHLDFGRMIKNILQRTGAGEIKFAGDGKVRTIRPAGK